MITWSMFTPASKRERWWWIVTGWAYFIERAGYPKEGCENMNVKKSLVGLIALAVMLGAMAVPAFAEPSVHTNIGQQLNASQGDTSGKPIVNITYKVVNDV